MSELNGIKQTKRDINYKVSLNEEQKLAKKGIFEKDVTFILGRQGSGKTQTAVLAALDLLHKKYKKKIVISRPVVKNNIGFLPGEMQAKMENQIAPIKHCMYEAYGVESVDKYFANKVIEILPVDFMKGITYVNSVVIIDEFQDLDYEEFILTLTRLGKDSKVIYTGSAEQIDKSVRNSCINHVLKLKDNPLVNFHTLKENHRNNVIFEIIKAMES